MKRLNLSILLLFFVLALSAQKKETDYLVTIHTDFGVMKVILFDDTPIHKANFIKMVEAGAYDNNTFHRVIDNFMIQGGQAPKEIDKGKSFKEKTIPAELNTQHKHVYGAVAAARTGNPEKRSDHTQFYIVENFNGTPHLDGQYTVFGQVVSGLHVINKIASQPTGEGGLPNTPITFKITVEKVTKEELKKYYNLDY